MSEKTYYCSKCRHNHRYSSKIGKRHLIYQHDNFNTSSDEYARTHADVQELSQKKVDNEKRLNLIQNYRNSYRKGIEKYGKWWLIFQISMWSFALIFLLTAAIIVLFYLPQVKMIVG